MRGGAHEKRIHYIDALKGFAIILVVIEHVANGYLKLGKFHEDDWFLYGVDNVIYGFHMQLFMIISGYLFRAAYSNGGILDEKRISHKILNNVILYCVFCVAFAFVKIMVGSANVNEMTTIKDLILIPIKPIGLFWYIYVLIIYYLLFSYISRLKINGYILLGCFAVLSICSQLIDIPWFCLGNVLFYSPFFQLGLIMQQRKDSRIFDNAWISGGMFIFSIVLYILFWGKEDNVESLIHYRFLVSQIVGFGMSVSIWFVFKHNDSLGNNHFLQKMGQHSLEIYLIHVFLTAGLRIIWAHIGINNILLELPLTTVISIFLPVLIGLLLKRIGIYELLFSPVKYFESTRNNSQS